MQVSDSESVLNAIYDIEEAQINIGKYDYFVPLSQISKQLGLATFESIVATLQKLQKEKQIILIDKEKSYFDVTPKEKFFVRSRIGHIIWCLVNSKNVSKFQDQDWRMMLLT